MGTDSKRYVGIFAVLIICAAANVATGQTTVIHAGTLLSVPGERPSSQQSLIVRDGRVSEIRNGYVDEWEQHPEDIQPFPDQMRVSALAGVLPLTGEPGEIDLDRACMPTGQGAGAILDIASCKEIVTRVVNEARETIERLRRLA